MQRRHNKQQETKKHLQDFMVDRQNWKREEQRRIDEENRKIEQYAEEQRRKDAELSAQKKAAANEKNAIYDRLASEMANSEKEKTDLENLRIELFQEEQREQDRNAELVSLYSDQDGVLNFHLRWHRIFCRRAFASAWSSWRPIASNNGPRPIYGKKRRWTKMFSVKRFSLSSSLLCFFTV